MRQLLRTCLGFCPPLLACAACQVQAVDLAVPPAQVGDTGGAPATSTTTTTSNPLFEGFPEAELAALVDERPTGGASLLGGTTGGGTWATAKAVGAITVAGTTEELIAAVAGDSPAVVLLRAGRYDLAETSSTSEATCLVACDVESALTAEIQPARKCAEGTATAEHVSSTRRLRVGSNKTLLGLGAGAWLSHVQLDLSGSSNVILRNVGISDVNPGIVGSGEALLLWPSHHVWVDHCSFARSSHSFVNIVSSWDPTTEQYAITGEAGYITLSFNDFDGTSADTCSGGQPWGVGTQRNPALTVHHNWLRGADGGNPYLFGPETWGHVYNNLIEDGPSYGVAVSCGATGLIEANVFHRTPTVLYIGDEGAPVWPFCATGKFGKAWAVFDASDDPANNLRATDSQLRLAAQPIDGAALELPHTTGTGMVVDVRVPAGLESYGYAREAATESWAAALPGRVGAGRLFP